MISSLCEVADRRLMAGLCIKLTELYDFRANSFMHRYRRILPTALLLALTLTACSGPKVLNQTDDSITFAFPSGRYGLDDVKEDAELYCRKRGRHAEPQGDKACSAACLSCPLQCRATFVCR